MRYGSPAIPDAIEALRDCDRVVVLPLFPQHAMSSTETAIARVTDCFARSPTPEARSPLFVPAFHADPGFLDAFAAVAAPVLADARADHVLRSRSTRPAPSGRSRRPATSAASWTPRVAIARPCSRRATARSATRPRARPWRGSATSAHTRCASNRGSGERRGSAPHTDVVLDELLAHAGTKRLAVICPAFWSRIAFGGLLEEIGIRGRAQFRAAGGDELVLVPSLNATQRRGSTRSRGAGAARCRGIFATMNPLLDVYGDLLIVRPPVPARPSTRPARTTRARSRTSSTRRDAPTTSGSRSSTRSSRAVAMRSTRSSPPMIRSSIAGRSRSTPAARSARPAAARCSACSPT